jgi:hypothetical protein
MIIANLAYLNSALLQLLLVACAKVLYLNNRTVWAEPCFLRLAYNIHYVYYIQILYYIVAHAKQLRYASRNYGSIQVSRMVLLAGKLKHIGNFP